MFRRLIGCREGLYTSLLKVHGEHKQRSQDLTVSDGVQNHPTSLLVRAREQQGGSPIIHCSCRRSVVLSVGKLNHRGRAMGQPKVCES